MKKILIIIAIFTAFNAEAQWIQTTGPERGFVSCIVTTGNDVYAGTHYAGVFRLNDFRKNWFQVNTGLTSPYINAFAVVDSFLFAGTGNGGIFRSSDNGGNWTAVNNGLTELDILTLYKKNDIIYAGTSSGLFLTTDLGTNWSALGLEYKSVMSLLIQNDTIYAGTNSNGIYRSANNGQNWIAVNNGLVSNIIATLAAINNYLFAGTGAGVYRSSNAGINWSYIGLSTQNYNIITAKGGNLFASNGYGSAYKTTDFGLNWIQVFNSLPHHVINTIYTNGTDLLIGSDFGVYVSTNDGENWSALNNRFTNELVISFSSCGPYIFAGTESNGIFKSSNEGMQWVPCGLEDKSVFCIAASGTTIIAGTVLSGGIYFSTDYGANWTAKNNGLTNMVVLALLVRDSSIFAGTEGGIFRSTNNGDNWTLVNSGMTNNYIYALGANSTFVYAGSDNMQGDMFRSSDDGLTWTAINNGLTYKITRSILTVGSNIYAGTQGGVFFSTNNGDNWETIGLSNAKVYSLHRIGGRLYAGTNKGVYLYVAESKTWLNRNQGFNFVPIVFCLINSQNYILAGTNFQSVWRRSLEDYVGINPNTGLIPKSASLFQNFPNPFNPETRIRYSLPRSSFVNLVVYDALGREVQNLVNEKQAPGTYEAEFNSSAIPSGVYFYRLTAEGYSETRKMVVIK